MNILIIEPIEIINGIQKGFDKEEIKIKVLRDHWVQTFLDEETKVQRGEVISSRPQHHIVTHCE